MYFKLEFEAPFFPRSSLLVYRQNNDATNITNTFDGMEKDIVTSPRGVAFTVFKTIVTILGLLCNITTFFTLTLNAEGLPQISRMLLQHQAIIDCLVCLMGVGIYTQKFMWMTTNHVFNFILCQVWHSQVVYWLGVLLSENIMHILFDYNQSRSWTL